MRPNRFVLLILLAVWNAGSAARAELRCAIPTADLGTLRGGPVVTQRFECVNTGDAALEITDVRRDCNCLLPTFDKHILPPGARTTIAFQVRTLGQPNGPRSGGATVCYRAKETVRETTLTITATIVNEVTVEPPVLALYVTKGLRQEVRVKDTRTPALKVTAVQASLPALKVTIGPAQDGVTVIALDVTGDALSVARQDATLNIYTDDPYYRHLQVPVTLQQGTHNPLVALPSRVVARGAVSTSLIRLRAAEGRKVVVASASSDERGISATWAAGPGHDATLRVTVRRAGLTGTHPLRVQFTEPAGAKLTIPVVVEE